jgi:hypothetical protein
MCICWIYYINLNITESSLEINFLFLRCLKHQFALGSSEHSTTTVKRFLNWRDVFKLRKAICNYYICVS